MADDIAIKVDKVSKTFKLPHEKNTSIKSAAINFYKRKRSFETQQVLKDISFEIKKGEFFGIVGRNGSGKSTLLKMLAGIYSSNKGEVTVKGRLTPFIELGVGFNPELTGRENVFLNGALLGFSRKDMMLMYDEIVEFAELEKFMDQKLKNYSSGMQVRLAFSIAIRAKSDILVLDEVLAVGDEAFQRKCIKVFDSYKSNKQTVVLVTHDMETVKKYCTRAILLSEGKIIEAGDPREVAAKYSKLNQATAAKAGKNIVKVPDDSISEIIITFTDRNKTGQPHYKYGEQMHIAVQWPKTKKVDMVGVAIYSSIGECVFASNTDIDGYRVKDTSSITYSVDLELGAGDYFVSAGTFFGPSHDIVDFVTNGPSFTVDEDIAKKGVGLTRLNHTWNGK
jgi:ABC-2 type transport system ATP-binding protein